MEFGKKIIILIAATSVSIVLLLFMTKVIDLNEIHSHINATLQDIEQQQELQRQRQAIIEKSGCTLVDGRCFNVYLERYRTWSNAKKFCLDEGGYMPSFPGNEFNLIHIFETLTKLKGRTYVYLWVDCADHTSEGKWLWGTGDIFPLNDTRWGKGEPNDDGGNGYFLQLYYYTKYGKLISNYADRDYKVTNNMICEF